MKSLNPFTLAAMMAALSCVPCGAQVVVVDTPTTYAGTVTQYDPVRQMLEVRQESTPTPVTYFVTQATTIEDESGTPVVGTRITSGVPVQVYYTRQGDRMMASRIVVRKVVSVPVPAPVLPVERTTVVPVEQTTTVTTTTAGGTITRFSAGSPTMVLRAETGAEPLTYSVSKTTTFVDENGTPIAVERIAPGLPVTVQYVREGDQRVVSRVVVVREPKRKLSEDEKEALDDLGEAQKDLRDAQRERKEDLREKRRDRDD